VQKVVFEGKQVAEIALEYIKSIDKQVTVVYPCDANGKADLTKGVTTTGAAVVWDLDKNTATVGEEGSTAASTVYLVDGNIQMAYAGATAETTTQADVIVDRRGTQTETYTIVKIGTQYWMAENLRARFFADGSAIAAISETDETGAWAANTTGAYLTDSNADWVKMAGLLYNGFCVTNEKGIAPAGWEVPTQAQLTKLRSAGNLKAMNFKSALPLTWSEGATGNNMTGFSAIATGYYSTATGLNSMLSETWFWSSTKYYDAFSKGDNLDTLRITSTTTGNVVVSSSMLGGHLLQFGHAIRCVRK
ncbi:MAG: fibrobacter succinogenes major paralogous domain-containing protein, partial [Muribaculaceae bacterium]|nr:fibrobacter succinogenes major paralogous domain-containing protein [Muribaculaceae bacterium]